MNELSTAKVEARLAKGTGMKKWLSILALLTFSSSANALGANTELSSDEAKRALTVASDYAVEHFGAPSCHDPNSNWLYRVRLTGSTVVADIGPKKRSYPAIRIVMRESDLGVIKAVKR